MRHLFLITAATGMLVTGCSDSPETISFTSTTQDSHFERQTLPEIEYKNVKPDAVIFTDSVLQQIDGFGGCFNELGWQALGALRQEDREEILKEFFAPGYGASFNICRMPVGANDFSVDWYSYDETPGDFGMKNFKIENDSKTLIPFIKAAYRYNPDILLWASPWCPPSWMKHNGHYASKPSWPGAPPNGLSPDREGFEGTDMFITEPVYLEAYALYFRKFIEAYRTVGIKISAVAPQNEFNSAQVFPSCCWTAKGLNNFVGNYLGPEMKELGVETWFGTLERPNMLLADTLLNDPVSSAYIKAVTFQWAGKGAIEGIHRKYAEMKLIQSESECGDGKNDWNYCLYTWSLMKHYFSHGASVYEYWNLALEENGLSRWGWRQNSLVTVNEDDRTYRYNYEFYLMKHFSHFIKPGAHLIKTGGNDKDLLVFSNPDSSLVILIANTSGTDQKFCLNIGTNSVTLDLKASSVNTVVLNQGKV
jgi:glucosylceramidase